MQIRLSDHFTLGRLLRFTLPSVIMMVVASLYSVVDGLFVSNLVGDLALSAVNIVMPIAMIVGAFGFMLGTGGSAIVARTMGEGDRDLANRYFSLFVWCVVGPVSYTHLDVYKRQDIILTTSNLGHIQIHTIIPLIGIIPLVFLIHSLQSIIPTARLSLRALKEGFI